MPKVIANAPQDMSELDMSEYLTTDQVARGFSKTTMTIFTWREQKGLPYTVIKAAQKDSIRFKIADIQEWAEKANMPFNLDAATNCATSA